MGLLQKKPQVSSSIPVYTLAPNNTFVIVGLGNPGKQYDNTRHNIGFACLDSFAAKLDFPKWALRKDLHCLITKQTIDSNRVVLVKPTTFMNLSGQAAQAVSKFYKIKTGNVTAVYDELDIEFGQIRTRVGGSSAGHNGVKSMIELLGEDFNRVRIGIHNRLRSKVESADFVLGKFTQEEKIEMPNLLQEVNSILSEFVHSGALPTETRSFKL